MHGWGKLSYKVCSCLMCSNLIQVIPGLDTNELPYPFPDIEASPSPVILRMITAGGKDSFPCNRTFESLPSSFTTEILQARKKRDDTQTLKKAGEDGKEI